MEGPGDRLHKVIKNQIDYILQKKDYAILYKELRPIRVLMSHEIVKMAKNGKRNTRIKMSDENLKEVIVSKIKETIQVEMNLRQRLEKEK